MQDKCYCTESSLSNISKFKVNKYGVVINKLNVRYARMKETINTITWLEWMDILKLHKYKCAYCGVKFTLDNIPIKDHVIPISKSGTNSKDNIVPACKECNMEKGDKYHRRNGELWAKDNKLIKERFK